MARRWRVLAVALAVAGGGLLWAWSGPAAGPRLRTESWPLVRAGQTQAEVEGLLGGPPGNYGRHAGGGAWMTLEGIIAPAGSVERVWCDDGTRLEVWFDPGGRVVVPHKRAGYGQHSTGVWERVRLWARQLGL